MKLTRLIWLGALAVAAPVAAQNPPDSSRRMPPMPGPGGMAGQGQHMMMGGMMGDGAMGRIMGFAPDHLLSRRDVLGLTEQQVMRLTALREAARTAHDAARSDHDTHMNALGQATNATQADTAAVRQHFTAGHAAMGDAHWAVMRAALQARALLTDAQRGRVDGWLDMQGPGHPMQPGQPNMPQQPPHPPALPHRHGGIGG